MVAHGCKPSAISTELSRYPFKLHTIIDRFCLWLPSMSTGWVVPLREVRGG